MGVGEAIGLGLLAGLDGTIFLTLSERVEMALTGRRPSKVPGQVGAILTGKDPDTDPELDRKNVVVHWAHGIALGAVRGLLALTGLGSLLASVLIFALVWTGDVLLYRMLGIAPAPWSRKRRSSPQTASTRAFMPPPPAPYSSCSPESREAFTRL
ncbi:MAG: hypothetical protein H0U42_10335 [Thermoleophilaceae bacterium]|nr:hypothetical protein [Thermoleophilaceae bacterium]